MWKQYFPLSSSSSRYSNPLRVSREIPGHLDAEAGSAAISWRLRRGAGSLYSSSCKRQPDRLPWFGVMPVGRSGVADLLGWFRYQIGFLLLLFQPAVGAKVGGKGHELLE
jgi:hypothetical protein